MRIDWNDRYLIGNTEIDAQHQIWFGKVNSFLEATGTENLTLCEMNMYQYTRVHFKHEEMLMRSLDYPDLSEHVKKHNEMLSHLNVISEQLLLDSFDASKWKSFLRDWMLNHIATVDAKLAHYAAQH